MSGFLAVKLLFTLITTVAAGEADVEGYIDAYTAEIVLQSGSEVSLGTLVLMACRASGVAGYGEDIRYNWTCPNGPCSIGRGGAANRFRAAPNTLIINTISVNDAGTYTCEVSDQDMNNKITLHYELLVKGGKVLFSNSKLILASSIIMESEDITAPGQSQAEVHCRVESGEAGFYYLDTEGYVAITTDELMNVYQKQLGSLASLIIKSKQDFPNGQYHCRSSNDQESTDFLYVYLFLNQISNVTSEELDTPQIDTISVLEDMRMDVKLRNFTFPEVSSPISSFVVDYDRLHNGRPIKARYQRYNSEGNTLEKRQIAVPGGQYRVKVWAVHGGVLSGPSDEVEYTVEETLSTPPRALSVTRTFEEGVELNLVRPLERNGDIQYIIRLHEGRDDHSWDIAAGNQLTYQNVTGLTKGKTYFMRVLAANSAGVTPSQYLTYTHLPQDESPVCPSKELSLTGYPHIGILVQWDQNGCQSESIRYTRMPTSFERLFLLKSHSKAFFIGQSLMTSGDYMICVTVERCEDVPNKCKICRIYQINN